MKQKNAMICYISLCLIVISLVIKFNMPAIGNAFVKDSPPADTVGNMEEPLKQASNPEPELQPQKVVVPHYVDKRNELMVLQNGSIVTDDRGTRYYTLSKSDEKGETTIQYVFIPPFSGKDFKEDDTTVYARSAVKLYSTGTLTEDAGTSHE